MVARPVVGTVTLPADSSEAAENLARQFVRELPAGCLAEAYLRDEGAVSVRLAGLFDGHAPDASRQWDGVVIDTAHRTGLGIEALARFGFRSTAGSENEGLRDLVATLDPPEGRRLFSSVTVSLQVHTRRAGQRSIDQIEFGGKHARIFLSGVTGRPPVAQYDEGTGAYFQPRDNEYAHRYSMHLHPDTRAQTYVTTDGSMLAALEQTCKGAKALGLLMQDPGSLRFKNPARAIVNPTTRQATRGVQRVPPAPAAR